MVSPKHVRLADERWPGVQQRQQVFEVFPYGTAVEIAHGEVAPPVGDSHVSRLMV
jgi:hypothetical protein